MDEITLTALKGSIAKWEAIVAGTDTDRGGDNCPLCQMFYKPSGPHYITCNGCPVSDATGQSHCDGSPYEWYYIGKSPEELKIVAAAELDFLRSLLPQSDGGVES